MPPVADNLNNPVAVIFTIIILKFNIHQLKDGWKCKEKIKKNNLGVIHNFTMWKVTTTVDKKRLHAPCTIPE